MSAALARPDAPAPAAHAEAATAADATYIGALDRLLAKGETIVSDLVDEDISATMKAVPFERLAGAIRRTIALARHIVANQPAPAKTLAEVAKTKATTARRRIARSIDDEIVRATSADADLAALRAELHERLDDPALDLDIANRPVESIIADIRRDLGLANGEHRIWPRRTPADARALAEFADPNLYADAPNLADEPEDPIPASVATLIRRHTISDDRSRLR